MVLAVAVPPAHSPSMAMSAQLAELGLLVRLTISVLPVAPAPVATVVDMEQLMLWEESCQRTRAAAFVPTVAATNPLWRRYLMRW